MEKELHGVSLYVFVAISFASFNKNIVLFHIFSFYFKYVLITMTLNIKLLYVNK